MAEGNSIDKNIFSADDPLDINELAALNDDISMEFIEQLQNQISQNTGDFNNKQISSNDADLFEEPATIEEPTVEEIKPAQPVQSFEDSFEKKFKAKQMNQTLEASTVTQEPQVTEVKTEVANPSATTSKTEANDTKEIEKLTSGNILEKPVSSEAMDYKDSLDYLDDNVKYTKYVIYINPENKEFIDSLTVKERKNLINRILREQDDVTITKRRLSLVQTIIKHSIIAIITVAISIPVIYVTINASLEASINNYRRSGKMFQTLYKERGKIRTNNMR